VAIDEADRHLGRVYALAFDPDGQFVASGSLDRTVKIWALSKTSRPRVTQTIRLGDAVSALAVGAIRKTGESTPVPRVLAAAFDGSINLVDINSGGISTPVALTRVDADPTRPARALALRTTVKRHEFFYAAGSEVFRIVLFDDGT
jgi:hypothetical protein